jgi:hypothetical protein
VQFSHRENEIKRLHLISDIVELYVCFTAYTQPFDRMLWFLRSRRYPFGGAVVISVVIIYFSLINLVVFNVISLSSTPRGSPSRFARWEPTSSCSVSVYNLTILISDPPIFIQMMVFSNNDSLSLT